MPKIPNSFILTFLSHSKLKKQLYHLIKIIQNIDSYYTLCTTPLGPEISIQFALGCVQQGPLKRPVR